mmetsp:Transcript_356/g.611  ORF Transcript_356/g.611 Transcript_356/m.611 type:complete len:88 (+) Transcript_356:56-319(+)
MVLSSWLEVCRCTNQSGFCYNKPTTQRMEWSDVDWNIGPRLLWMRNIVPIKKRAEHEQTTKHHARGSSGKIMVGERGERGRANGSTS